MAIFFIFVTATAHGSERGTSPWETPSIKSWLSQDTATGDWQGLRNQLENRGVTISSNYTTDIAANPVGGREQALRYAGFLDLAVALDFEKIASAKGLNLTVSNFWASGRNLSSVIDNFFGVQQIYTPGDYFFGEMDLSLALLDDTLVLETGRLFAGDVFATCDMWQYYVNGGINDNLNSMPANIFFPAFNVASWAARVTYQPTKEWHLIAGMYDADPRVKKIINHGSYFSFNMQDGYLAIGQLAYKHHQCRKDNGLPGSMSVGGYYESSKFQDLADPARTRRGNYGFYVVADQMIYKGDWPEFKGPHYMSGEATDAERVKQPYHPQTAIAKDRPKGLTAWAAAYLAPYNRTNTQTYQITAGLAYQGLPPNRDRDVTAFCFILGNFSDELEGQRIETVLELNHRFQIGQWCYITPDVQYVIRPNGESKIPNALVLALEASVNF